MTETTNYPSIFNDVIGPIMRGPSSSHCAGALRIGRLARYLMNDNIEEVKLMFPCEANALFISLPARSIEYLKSRGWHFYTFIGAGGVRLMCSWDTKMEDINDIVRDIKDSIVKN